LIRAFSDLPQYNPQSPIYWQLPSILRNVEGQDSELFVILTCGQHLYSHESFESVVSGTARSICNVWKGVNKAGSTSIDHYGHMEGDTNWSSFSEQKFGIRYEPVVQSTVFCVWHTPF